MANFNKLILIGNLTKDPELVNTPGGTELVKSGIAVNRKRGDRETTMFMDFTLFGKGCETFCRYLKKGSPVLLEGRVELEQWEAQDGSKRSRHAMIVENFQFLGVAQGQGQQGEPKQQRTQQPGQQTYVQQPQGGGYKPDGGGHPHDDIPF